MPDDDKGRWLAFDVGCIECGEPSAVLGVYDTKAAAEAVCAEWDAIGWRGGQHSYQVFDLSQPGAGSPPPSAVSS